MEIDAVVGRALEVAEDLGLLAELERGERGVDSLAAELSLAPRGLRPLLYLLTSAGLLSQQGETFSLSEAGVSFWREDWPARRQALVRLPDWERLDEAVRTGRCVRPPIEGDEGEFFAQVVGTLFSLHFPAAQHLHTVLPEEASRFLDLGAGSAVWSLGVVSRRPEASAVAVDKASVLEGVTRDVLARHEVEQRYTLRPGSYFEVELESGQYDVIFLGHIVHSEGWERSATLFGRCYQALAPGGSLVIAEMLGADPRGLDHCSNLFDLNMLMFTEAGCVFTRGELEELAAGAGFVEPHWVDGPGQYPPLLVRKPDLSTRGESQ